MKGFSVMNILICDDDYRFTEEVEESVRCFFKDKPVELNVDIFTDGEDLLKNNNKLYDIAFLDIELGDVKGTQIAEKMKSQNPHTLFFFITAYERYLDEAMDLRAIRFLTKPLNKERLYNGLKSATDLIDKSVVEFMIKNGDTFSKVHSGDIIYVEINGRFTKVVTINDTLYSSERIEYWQEKLSTDNFYRIHKSFIINTDYITKYTRDNLILNNQYIVPIAYRERTIFRKHYLDRIEELQK